MNINNLDKEIKQYKAFIENNIEFCYNIKCDVCVFNDDNLCNSDKFYNGYTLNYAKHKLSQIRKEKLKNVI
jgi:hypothetical protein